MRRAKQILWNEHKQTAESEDSIVRQTTASVCMLVSSSLPMIPIFFCRQGWVCDYVNLASIASLDYICLLLVVVSVAAFSRRSEVEHETVPSRLRTEKSIVASPPARLIEDNFVSIHQKVLTLSIDWWGEMSRWCFLLLTDYVLSSVVKENLSPPSVPTKTIFYTYPTV